jgi:hypothetical protein
MWILFINVQWNCVASHIKISTLSIGNSLSNCVEINKEESQILKLTKFDLV